MSHSKVLRGESAAVVSMIGPSNQGNAKTTLVGSAYQGGPANRLQKFFSRLKVMAMSRKDAINQLREQLIRRRDALHRALEGDLSLLRELHQERTGDIMDAAADAVQDELNSQLIEAESRELGEINSALDRIKQRTYGDCETCEKPIPLTRLRAIPYAVDCIGCRRKAESRASGGGAVLWNRVFDNAEVDPV
jgi:DnaK suppressor protein